MTRSGSSLIEVTIGMTIAVVGILGLMASVTTGSQLQEQTQHFGQASRAVQGVHEALRNGDLDDRVAEFKATPTFDDGELTVTVSFPEQVLVDATGSAVPVGWRYRDLDADGEVDLDAGATASASLLPVSVQVSWTNGEMASTFLVTEK